MPSLALFAGDGAAELVLGTEDELLFINIAPFRQSSAATLDTEGTLHPATKTFADVAWRAGIKISEDVDGDGFQEVERPRVSYFAPSWMDVDGDSVKDLVVGVQDGSLRFFKLLVGQGTGGSEAGGEGGGEGGGEAGGEGGGEAGGDGVTFEEWIDSINPMNGITVTKEAMPAWFDLNGDQMEDLGPW